jgi:hypothetical protein
LRFVESHAFSRRLNHRIVNQLTRPNDRDRLICDARKNDLFRGVPDRYSPRNAGFLAVSLAQCLAREFGFDQREGRQMKRLLLSVVVVAGGTCLVGAAEFQRPVRLKTGDTAIRVESPGYAAPCWADLRGNGHKQLLVGQFNDGKIRVFDYLGGEQFRPGEWLRADGEVAQVPGVW